MELATAIEEIPSWYHVIDLGDGVVTPGAFDMSRYIDLYPIPKDMSGMRVLDVGASNGYFSVEFARRGAAEVVALDLPGWVHHDWSPRQRTILEDVPAEEMKRVDETVVGKALELVIDATGFQGVIKPEPCAIYDISPERFGSFDLVFCGSMLMHVRDPLLGIHAMRSVCKPGGHFLVSVSTIREQDPEPIAAFVGEWDQSNFWQLNPAALRRMLATADFECTGVEALYDQKAEIAGFTDRIYLCQATPRRDS